MTKSKGIRVPSNEAIGKKFHRLLVLKLNKHTPYERVTAICKCECGVIKKKILVSQLRNGSIKSCGCWRVEQSTKRATKHGLRFTKEYWVWQQMFERCNKPHNKGYKRYGARGIRVCERWSKFENFIADMGMRPSPKHSLERENNDGHYSPDNCKWATRWAQARNTRRNIYYEYEGERYTAPELARKSGKNHGTIRSRLTTLGWPVKLAVEAPVPYHRKSHV